MIRIILSGACGLILLCCATALDSFINENMLGYKHNQTATLVSDGAQDSLAFNYPCKNLPSTQQMYCNNISIQRYGHLLSTANDNIEIPPGQKVKMLGHTAYQYCISGLYLGHCESFDSVDDLRNDRSTILMLLLEITVAWFLFACIAYYVLGKSNILFDDASLVK